MLQIVPKQQLHLYSNPFNEKPQKSPSNHNFQYESSYYLCDFEKGMQYNMCIIEVFCLDKKYVHSLGMLVFPKKHDVAISMCHTVIADIVNY